MESGSSCPGLKGLGIGGLALGYGLELPGPGWVVGGIRGDSTGEASQLQTWICGSVPTDLITLICHMH